MSCPACYNEVDETYSLVDLACGHTACTHCIPVYAERGQSCPASARCRNVPLCYADEDHAKALARKRRELAVARARVDAMDFRFTVQLDEVELDNPPPIDPRQFIKLLEKGAYLAFVSTCPPCSYLNVLDYVAKGRSPFVPYTGEPTKAEKVAARRLLDGDSIDSHAEVRWAAKGRQAGDLWGIETEEGKFLAWDGAWSLKAQVPASCYTDTAGNLFTIKSRTARLTSKLPTAASDYAGWEATKLAAHTRHEARILEMRRAHEVAVKGLCELVKCLEHDVEALEMRIEFDEPLLTSAEPTPAELPPAFALCRAWALPSLGDGWLASYRHRDVIALNADVAVILFEGSVVLHDMRDGSAGDYAVRVARARFEGGYVLECPSQHDIFWFKTEGASEWRAVSLAPGRLGDLVDVASGPPAGYPGDLVVREPKTRQLLQVRPAKTAKSMPVVVAMVDY